MSAAAEPALERVNSSYRQILGLRFFMGTPAEAVERMSAGGLLVVPAAPALRELSSNSAYREALLNADLAITDSAFMVLAWNFLQGDNIRRVSGLAYLRQLLTHREIRECGGSFWVMASPSSAVRNMTWLQSRGIRVNENGIYIAPIYDDVIEDSTLLAQLRECRPRHIVITLGGGTQERLGLYLKRNLGFRPAIHCIGAAIAFLSGDQVPIPVWADRLYLGWLFRCLAEPKRYVCRYWRARKLLPLIVRYRDKLPLEELS